MLSSAEEPRLERKRLEWELSLARDDIRSNAWFHGNVTRSQAERLLTADGHFLVRNQSGRKDMHVLSCRSQGHVLHFVISRVTRGDGQVGFAFEEEAFDSVSDLITSYVGNKRPVSAASMAIISTPVNRSHPLTDLDFYLNKDTKNAIQVKYESPIARTTSSSPPPPPKPDRPKEFPDSRISLICDKFPKNSAEEVLSLSFSELKKSRIRAQNFQTFLLPKDNKPLDSSAIRKIQSVLLDTGPRILANHLLKCDLEFSRDLDLSPILVPKGRQLRRDFIERHLCLKYFVLITILTTISAENRKLILNKWIAIALEVKTALGDLFGFAAIMEALAVPSVVGLKSWSEVRRDFTQNAIIYETKLKPQLKAMTECTEPQAPNTTFPFVLTLIQILEKHSKLSEMQELDKNMMKTPQLLDQWFEQTSIDCGLQQVFDHLSLAPNLIKQIPNYKRNSRSVLEGFKEEDLLCDMFRTEFHRQFLFGFRASDVECDEKFDKLEQIIAQLARSVASSDP